MEPAPERRVDRGGRSLPVCATPGCGRFLKRQRRKARHPTLCRLCEVRIHGKPAVDGDGARRRTIPAKRLTTEELAAGALLAPTDVERPRTRLDCVDGERPCPFVVCKYHLYLDVNPEIGSIKLNFPDLEPWELKESCALDVADRGGITLEEVGAILNLTRERIRQVEVRGLLKLKLEGELDGAKDLAVLDLLAGAGVK